MILVINGPNLNMLGKRDKRLYGNITLVEIETMLQEKASELNVRVICKQSNYEGALVEFIQQNGYSSRGVILNAGALTQLGYSLLDALLDTKIPFIEVHLSNIHAREEFRKRSVFAPYAVGQIAGLGHQGYIFALEYIANLYTRDYKS